MADYFSDAELDSLKRVESGKDKFAVNKDTKAMGAYQFLPETVQMLHKQGIEFNPFNETQARGAAKTYLNQLAEQYGGDKKKALAVYGGHITKDPSGYVDKVLSGVSGTANAKSFDQFDLLGVPTETKQKEPTDQFEILGVSNQAPKESEQSVVKTQQPIVQAPSIQGPMDVVKKFATPSASVLPKSVTEPIVGGAEALATLATGAVAPWTGTIYGIYKNIKEGKNERPDTTANAQAVTYQPRTEKGQQYVEKVAESMPEALQKVPLYVPGAGQISTLSKPSMTQVGTKVSKVAEPLVKQFEELKAGTPKVAKAGEKVAEAPVISKVSPLEVPKEQPINRAEISPLKPEEVKANEDVLSRVGITNMRKSALEQNPKEAASQYITAKAEQGPYGTGMTEQINHEKSALTNHFGQLEQQNGGVVPRTGTQFEITDKIEAGKTIKNAAEEALTAHKNETTRLYNQANNELGTMPVELPSLKGYLDKKSNFVQSSEKSLRNGVVDYLNEQGLIDKGGNIKPMTVAESEKLRKFINSQYNHETKNKIGDLVNLIDDDVFKNVKGETFESARAHFKKGKEIYDNPKAMRDLLSDEGVNQKIADEKVINKIVTLDESQFGHMMDVFAETGKKDAINQVRTSLVNRIKEAGQSAANEPWNSIAAAKERAKLGNKLNIAFADNPEMLAKIDDGIIAGNIIHIPTKYPGAGVQTHLLKNKFVDIGLRKAGTAIGGAVGGGFGALVGEAAGEKVSQGISAGRQTKQLKKEIKFPSEQTGKNKATDFGLKP